MRSEDYKNYYKNVDEWFDKIYGSTGRIIVDFIVVFIILLILKILGR